MGTKNLFLKFIFIGMYHSFLHLDRLLNLLKATKELLTSHQAKNIPQFGKASLESAERRQKIQQTEISLY